MLLGAGCTSTEMLALPSRNTTVSPPETCSRWKQLESGRSTGFSVQGSVFRVRGSGFRVQGSGVGVQGAGFMV